MSSSRVAVAVGVGVGEAVGNAVSVAATAAWTVASMSGVGVADAGTGVAVGLRVGVALGSVVVKTAATASPAVAGVGNVLRAVSSKIDSVKRAPSSFIVFFLYSSATHLLGALHFTKSK
jgi:hypothetical protein